MQAMKAARKTDTDSGIHSFGSASSCREIDVKLNYENNCKRVRSYSWRDNLLDFDRVRRHSDRHTKISRSEVRSRSQEQEDRRQLSALKGSRRSRSYTSRGRSRVSGQRLTLISSYHHIPRARTFHTSSVQSSSSPASTEDEDALSLAFIQNNAIIHQYVASRGQREKEIEIYEVLPTTIRISRHRHQHRTKY